MYVCVFSFGCTVPLILAGNKFVNFFQSSSKIVTIIFYSLHFNRRLHRLLLIKRSCHQCWNNVPWKRERLNAQLVCDRLFIFLALLNTNP